MEYVMMVAFLVSVVALIKLDHGTVRALLEPFHANYRYHGTNVPWDDVGAAYKVAIDVQVLSNRVQSLEQIINPQSAPEVLTAARMRDEVLRREEFEKRVNAAIAAIATEVKKQEMDLREEAKGVQRWIFSLLTAAIGALATLVWVLVKRIAKLSILVAQFQDEGMPKKNKKAKKKRVKIHEENSFGHN